MIILMMIIVMLSKKVIINQETRCLLRCILMCYVSQTIAYDMKKTYDTIACFTLFICFSLTVLHLSNQMKIMS